MSFHDYYIMSWHERFVCHFCCSVIELYNIYFTTTRVWELANQACTQGRTSQFLIGLFTILSTSISKVSIAHRNVFLLFHSPCWSNLTTMSVRDYWKFLATTVLQWTTSAKSQTHPQWLRGRADIHHMWIHFGLIQPWHSTLLGEEGHVRCDWPT